MNEDIEQLEKDFEHLGNKVHSFKRTRVIIKLMGVFGMLIAAFLTQWFYAFVLWLLFFPDSEEIIRFFKKKLTTKV